MLEINENDKLFPEGKIVSLSFSTIIYKINIKINSVNKIKLWVWKRLIVKVLTDDFAFWNLQHLICRFIKSCFYRIMW